MTDAAAPTAPAAAALAAATLSPAHWAMVAITLAVVAVAVMAHYEALSWLSRALRRVRWRPRPRIAALMFALLAVHVAEIWLFGLAHWLVLLNPDFGTLRGDHAGTFFDHIYYSAAVYTTVGFGDMTPVGLVRFLSGTEGLVGFMLITWSASFTYLEMQRFWRDT